ncbi:hypothetical protein WA026_002813 [Henosepilachna vigintioctopunctata]|uniref:Uncharacterized protein n=1 Tax=Henosepilachna vigintioctopunctata TaxID=420089 RepID=A0AAW1U0J5_9CUCU
MNPKFSLLTSPPSSPPEQEQQKQCFLVRIHDSTVVENQLLEQLGNVARASVANGKSTKCPQEGTKIPGFTQKKFKNTHILPTLFFLDILMTLFKPVKTKIV